jgi:hypothetical protein
MEKNSNLGSGIQDGKNLDPVSWIRDGKHSDSGFRIRDKHPRSAKLEISSPDLLGLKEPNNNGTQQDLAAAELRPQGRNRYCSLPS